MSNTLLELKQRIFADGYIDQTEVDLLRQHCSLMDREKADFLFQIKDVLQPDRTDPSFYELFIEKITASLLEDDLSPGEINETEAKWLRAKITRKGYTDKIDKRLLDNLKRKSITYPSILSLKSQTSRYFETLLFAQRFVSFLAVIGSMLASVVLFIASSVKIVEGIHYALVTLGDEAFSTSKQVVFFVEAIDGYLFATVLIIFSMGTYELFINKIDPVSLKSDSRPSWLRIATIDDLKNYLAKVILMILIVSFFERSIEMTFSSVQDLLFLAVGTLLLAGALFLTHRGTSHA